MSGGDSMEIEITSLLTGTDKHLEFNQPIDIPKEYYQNTDIKALQNVVGKGHLLLDGEEFHLQVHVSGEMILNDAISLEEEKYPFTCEVIEKVPIKLEKMKNTLDITEILWQNIMLEVPLRFTTVDDYSKYQGDGWKLTSEEELKVENNPFNDLKKMMGGE